LDRHFKLVSNHLTTTFTISDAASVSLEGVAGAFAWSVGPWRHFAEVTAHSSFKHEAVNLFKLNFPVARGEQPLQV